MERVILHVDMNAYFAAVAQATNPRLLGKPVLVAGSLGTRGVITCPSYEARKYGVRTGMTVPEGKRLCPQAIVVSADAHNYVTTSLRLRELFEQFTPQVENFSIDEAFLDITGTERLFGPPVQLANTIKRRIREEIADITCSVGIAPNRLLAKLASGIEKPDGLVVITKDKIAEVLEKTPVEEMCGIGPKLTYQLKMWGIKTCGQLSRFPVQTLERRFGKIGRYLHLMSKGEDRSEVPPYYYYEKVKSIGHSCTLQTDTHDREVVRRYLLQLSEQVARRLRQGSYQGKTITLVVRKPDMVTLVEQTTLKFFTDDGVQIFQTANKILNKYSIETLGVRLVGVSVSNLTHKVSQLSLFWRERRKQLLLKAMDVINDRFGDFSVTWGRLDLKNLHQNNLISPAWRPNKKIYFGNI
ncbi:MAG: hypothetical protein A2142_03775 [candidate division Zixibacteria bacterium RBG_16_48_11]|nr:MAG: hypothetical protein A2142_03775 [candidate division Zixibacteria bacterium RBG_16_48_11]